MEDYILISQLNDFIFCPYSIYLHNVYMDADEDIYHATPQNLGKSSHETVDKKTYSNCKSEILSLPILSRELGVMGKIDIYHTCTKKLIERKYQLKQIFKGQIYQLWTQYFCLIEMGYEVESIGFYEISTNKTIPIPLPDNDDKAELVSFIGKFRDYDPEQPLNTNPNKCSHCIYCNLCDKTDNDNVYT